MRLSVICLLTSFLFSLGSMGQRTSYYNCEQGISLSHNNFYHLAFQGRKGVDKSDLKGYAQNQNLSKNQIWLYFDPPSSGLIQLNTRETEVQFSTFVFAEHN